ncbi:TonB-dependent receptor [Dyadobacter fermentans]|uniref:TonB-dependent siderophore receptor n=1 Tax=Dyadobacter fermentans (strain ATCC 700827 / DSM 18053 / CIP 107007 / KCTC 52180 / NS114) TaxID=471854 RepID=C6W3C0_DYAFD|nr:TonB-dependent receptor [Dyadobacter fermentans]ACT92224.1 TonB-dependent siderophore receptor [Dyadobacter fermentans DSM 18053]
MTKKLFLLAMLFGCVAGRAFAQNGSVSGAVRTSDGEPVELVTVNVKGTSKGALTDRNGKFFIRNLQPGLQRLVASFVGLDKQEQTVEVTAGGTVTLDFVLKASSAQLQEVIVSGRNLNRENAIVAKIPLKKLENPQVYNTVSAEIMKQQGITSYDDALRNVPGIARTWESTGRAGDGASYFALRGFDAQPTLYNGLPGLTSGNLDPANVEEIQVIKGPSSTLFGGAFYSYGGMINTITKKPYHQFGGEIAYNAGSFGLNRVTADINTPLSKADKIALRVNTAYHSENSFQDAGFKKSFFIAPALVYEVNDRLSLHLLAEFLEEERAVAPVFFHSDRLSPLPFKNLRDLNLNPRLSFTSNDLTIRNPRFNLQAQAVYKLSDQWTSQTVFSRGAVKSDGIYTYIWDDVSGDNWFSQYFHKEQQSTTTTDIQQNFNGDFKIGNMRNRLLVGVDYFRRNVVDNGSGWASARNVSPQGEVNYVNPYSGDTLAPVYLTQASIDNLLAGLEGSASNITNTSFGAYASNVLNIMPNLNVMLSLRADYFDSKGERSTSEDDFDQWALSPKIGIVYQPLPDKVSLFANYMNAFINVAPQQVTDRDGSNPRIKSFRPEHADQWEYGIKTNLFSDKLGATLSVYDIKVSDRVMPNPANIRDFTQGGKVGSKGFEIDVVANPVNGLSLIAGFSHNKTKVISGDAEDFYSEPGRSIGGQGPQNLANFWATYRISSGTLKNAGFGFGGNYAGEYKVIDNSKTGVFTLPAYTLLNASVFYNASHFRISLNVNNLTSKEYYIGYWSVNPQKPRNSTLSIAYKF